MRIITEQDSLSLLEDIDANTEPLKDLVQIASEELESLYNTAGGLGCEYLQARMGLSMSLMYILGELVADIKEATTFCVDKAWQEERARADEKMPAVAATTTDKC